MTAVCGGMQVKDRGKRIVCIVGLLLLWCIGIGAGIPASPERVGVPVPRLKLGNMEGEIIDYRWPEHCIRVDDTTVLIVNDYFFLDGFYRQRVFFLAEAPDFTLREVYRHDYKEVPEEVLQYHSRYEYVNWRMAWPIPVQDGYVYEVDKRLYHVSGDFKENEEVCDLRVLMGDLYDLYYAEDTEGMTCDISADVKRLLACTNKGLYEYNLESKEAKLLEKSVFKPHEHIEDDGDCLCGVPEYDFVGPARVSYTPDNRGYVFLTVDATQDAWGEITGITLRSFEDKTLYHKQIDEYSGDYKWMNTKETDYLAVFYRENEEACLDLVETDTGKSVTYKLPDEIVHGDIMDISFIDEHHLLYRTPYDDETRSVSFEIYQLPDWVEELPIPKQRTGRFNWKVTVLGEGGWIGYDTIVKYPEL